MTEEYQQLSQDKGLTERLDVDFALKAAGLGIWELDPATNVVSWDDRCRELYGLTASNQIPYEQAMRHIHPDDVVRVDGVVKWAMNPQSEGHYDATYRTIGADDGRLRWVRFTGRSYFNEAGEVHRFAGVGQDVTEEETAQQRLEASEERFRVMFEQAPVAIGVMRGEDLIIESANSKALEILGRPASIIGRPWLEALPELAGQPAMDVINDVYRTGVPFTVTEFPAQLEKDGQLEQGYYTFSYLPLKESGAITGILQVAIDVTDQVIARKNLQESEHYFHQLTDTIPAIIWTTEPDGNCNYLNKQWYENTGQTEEEAKGFGWLDATHPDNREEAGRLFTEANEQQIPFSVVYRLRQKDGSYRWSIDKGSPRFDAYGAYAGMIGTVVDIHDQKLAEEAAKQFKYMADNATDPFILMRKDGTFAYLNKLALDRWGYTAEEAICIRVPDVDPIFNEAVFGAAFAQAQAGQALSVETLHRKKDGTIYPVEVNMGGVEIGHKPHMFAVARDITERRKAEQDLRESETLFRNVTNSAPTGLWLSDEAGGLVYLNNTLVEWTGMSYDALLGAGWANAISEEDRQRSVDTFLNAVTARAHYDTLFRIKKKDGSLMWCRAAGDPYYGADGSYVGYAGFCADIDELLQQKQASEAAETRFRSVIATAPAAMGLFLGRDLIVEMPNQAFINIVGKGPDIVGKPLREVMPELEGQPFLQILDDVYTSGITFQSYGAQVDIMRQGVMTHNFYNITYTPLFDAEGKVYAILDVAIDVTEEVEGRQKLEESEKRFRTLSAELDRQVQERTQQLQASVQDLQRSNQNLQQFAYVASHDLQEPLRKIQSFGDLLKTQYVDQLGEGIDHLQRMQSAASRMSVLIKDLLTYSRISTQQQATTPVSLTEVVQAVLSDLDVTIIETGAQVTVETLPTVPGDKSQLGQLFQNLLSNALKFRRSDTNPIIQISAQRVAATDLPASVRPTQLATAYHCLEVSDNGIGFDDKYVDRIFQVFQRLHGRNEFAGTGIGLAICEKVAANHGGAITATSRPGQGATFSVYLPVLD